ncbi:MAG: hypothetical protein JNM84_19545 [Planctomycetes bacterium]|nr:hypothetical protein [Planctomycetota bacterium]
MSRRSTCFVIALLGASLALWILLFRESRSGPPAAPGGTLEEQESRTVARETEASNGAVQRLPSGAPRVALPAALHVQLQDGEGLPIARGAIHLAERCELLAAAESLTASTDDAGRSRLTTTGDPRRLWCAARAEGYAAKILPPRVPDASADPSATAADEALTVTLERLAALELTVLTIEGDPVAGAAVEASAATHDPSLPIAEVLRGSHGFTGATDEHGFVRIPRAIDEVLALRVEKLGFATHRQELARSAAPAAEEQVVTLERILVGGFRLPRSGKELSQLASYGVRKREFAALGLAERKAVVVDDRAACFAWLRRQGGFEHAVFVACLEERASALRERRIELQILDSWDPRGPYRKNASVLLRRLEELRPSDLARDEGEAWSAPSGELELRFRDAQGRTLATLHPARLWKLRSLEASSLTRFVWSNATSERLSAEERSRPEVLSLTAGRYRLEPDPRLAVFAPRDVTVIAEERVAVEIALDEALLLRPRVFDEHGAPLSHAVIEVHGPISFGVSAREIGPLHPIVVARRTASDWSLRARAPGYRIERLQLGSAAAEGELLLRMRRAE